MTDSNEASVEMPFGRTNFSGVALVTLALALLAGSICSSAGSAGDLHILRELRQNRYELRGVVQSVDKAKKRATIKHEKVGDLMDAMTMPFLIKDERALNEMGPGDQIKATLVTTGDGGMWLEKITIIAKAKKGMASIVGGDQTDKTSGLTGESGNDLRPPPDLQRGSNNRDSFTSGRDHPGRSRLAEGARRPGIELRRPRHSG
ncbi:MAG TPA: copper-binding protein [Blastocatellia bacterium]